MRFVLLLYVIGMATFAFSAEPKRYSTTTFAIVPVKEITKEMLAMSTSDTIASVPVSTNGLLGVLEWIEWKKPTDPMPTKYTNDIAFTAQQLDYNEKLSMYRWAHKITPEIMLKYKQFTHAQILVEMAKPEWVHKDAEPKEPVEVVK